MRGLSYLILALLGSASAAMAGSMPVLPDLPPLPTNYEKPAIEGAYVGILGGYSSSGPGGPALGVLVGNTMLASDLLIGIEGLALVSRGDASLDAGLRAGVAVTDNLSAHGLLGVGYSSKTEAYGVAGVSAEFRLWADAAVRVDYRYQHDFSGDAATHKLLAGVIRNF